MKAVEGDVSGAITSLENTLARIQDRLHRAETTTDTALKALEHTFANLDERISSVAAMANPEKTEAWRAAIEQRFDSLAKDLRNGVEESRRQLAEEIERAAAGARPELMGELETRVYALERNDSSDQIDQIGEQVASLSDTLDKRIGESERRSADAIEQVGEQVIANRATGLRDDGKRRIGRTGDRTLDPLGPGIVRLSATGIKACRIARRRRLNHDAVNALCLEVPAQCRDDVVAVRACDIAQLAMRPCPRCNGVDRTFGIAGFHGEDGKGVPRIDVFCRGQTRLSPLVIILRAVSATI